MLNLKKFSSNKTLYKLLLLAGLTGCFFGFDTIKTKTPSLASGLFEFRWNNDGTYKKLRYLQSSKQKLDRSTYYFFLRKSERKTAILKLSLKFPDYFKATLKTKNINLCKVQMGGYQQRTKCIKDLPAVVEIAKDMKTIDIYPNSPIPADKSTYAIRLKMFNPRKTGMYQINAFSQSPGELPISLYVGSYLIEIDVK